MILLLWSFSQTALHISYSKISKSNGIVSASFRVSHIIAKNIKPFTDGNYINDSLIISSLRNLFRKSESFHSN